LRAVKAIDWTRYVPFVENEVYRESAPAAYSPQRAQLGLLRESLGSLIEVPADPCFLPTETCARVELPVAVHLPDLSTTLEGYESFLASRPAVFWARFDHFAADRPFPRERARLSRIAVRPRLPGRFLHGGTDWYFDGEPPLGMVAGTVILTLAGSSPAVFEGNADVYVALLSDVTPARWLQTQKDHPVGKSMLDASGSHFVPVRRYWNSVSAKPLDGAIAYLQDRADTSRKQMSLFGLSMDADTVGLLGPLSLAALLVFLLAHVRHLASLDPHDEIARTYPWICLAADRLGVALTFSTVVLLPAAASAALVVRALGNLRETGRAPVIVPGAMTLVVLALSILIFAAIRGYRRKLAAVGAASLREHASLSAEEEAPR